MILLIDTTGERLGRIIYEKLEQKNDNIDNCDYVNATEMNISHCLGYNYCWLKTPGECVVKDDYEQIVYFKKIEK